jgi:hypothetical protein
LDGARKIFKEQRLSVVFIMDFSGSLRRGKKRRTREAADYSWASEKIQEVLSRGIQDQGLHLRKILLLSTRRSSESQLQCAAGAADTGELLGLRRQQLEAPPVHNMNWSQQLAMQLAGRKILRRSLTAKFQNSQDRCHALGLKRLQTSPSLQATVPKSQEAAFNIPRYSKHDIEHKSSDEPASLDSLDMQHPSCSKLMKLQHRRNLNSLRTPERTVPDSSLLTTSLFDEAAQAAFSSQSSMSYFLSNSRKTSSTSRLVDPSGNVKIHADILAITINALLCSQVDHTYIFCKEERETARKHANEQLLICYVQAMNLQA